MEYRKLGRTGLEVSAIGLGTEHLQHSSEEVASVFAVATAAGLSYVDLLCSDPAEDAFYRESIAPAVRAHRADLLLGANWGHPDRYPDVAYCRSCFEGMLDSVGNGYVEVAKLMMVDTEAKWNTWALPSLEHLRRYQQEGSVGCVGISSHRGPVALLAVESGLIDVLMYPFNLTSSAKEIDRRLLQACAECGVGVVAMKPYGGGSLLMPKDGVAPPTHLQCLHYVLSQPVSTTVAGAKDTAEMRQTLRYFEAAAAERDFGAALAGVHRYLDGQCTYCDHCLPCSQGIDVGRAAFLGDQARWALFSEFAAEYAAMAVPASACNECGTCSERCPFGVDAVAKVRHAAATFEG